MEEMETEETEEEKIRRKRSEKETRDGKDGTGHPPLIRNYSRSNIQGSTYVQIMPPLRRKGEGDIYCIYETGRN